MQDDILVDELFGAVRAKARSAHQLAVQLRLAAEDAEEEARAADHAVAVLSQLREEREAFSAAARRFLGL
ncbi:MAG TPA: hypothetical protein VHE35_06005 [Kofleriaceae bacterium]|jgi:hypothetical protein|nr:hypothetical protein [Kofleriaceae bacterium]